MLALIDVLPRAFTSDPAVIDRAQEIWPLFALMQPANGAVFALDGILIGAGDTRFLMWGMLAASLRRVRADRARVARLRLGIVGVWVGLLGLILVRLATCGWRFERGGRWARRRGAPPPSGGPTPGTLGRDGHHRPVGRRGLRRRRAPRVSSPRSTRGPRTPRWRPWRMRWSERAGEILEANARDMEAGRRPVCTRAARPPEARPSSGSRASPATCARSRPCPIRSARRSTGYRLENGLDVRRVRVPLGRGGRGLRGAAERDRRLLGAVPEVGQRDRAARLLDRPPTRTPCWPRWSPRPRRRRACPRARSRSSPAATATSCAQLATQDGVVDLIIPRGGRGAEGGAQGARHRAGDLRRGRQLPRVRGRQRRPRRRRGDHGQRQGPAPLGLQRGRDAAGARRRRGRLPAARARELRESGVELRVDGRTRSLAGRAGRLARRRHRGGLGDRVPRADPGREGRRLRSRRRSST